jgi:proteasome accessory factor C
VERTLVGRGRLDLEEGVFTTPYSDLGQLASWVLRQDGRARPLDPPELVAMVKDAIRAVGEAHVGRLPKVAKAAVRPVEPVLERPAGPIPAERFAVLQSLLAHLLVRCGNERRVAFPAAELVEAFGIPYELLEEHLQLLNLVNFGAGCYAVYSALDGDTVRVEKELFGDAFRQPPRLTPLEARSIRLALEFVGPLLKPPGANTPLDRVLAKLEETFGQFELRTSSEPTTGGEEEELIRALSEAIANRRVVELEYMRPGTDKPRVRTVEPHSFQRALPNWYVHVWDRERDASRSFRLDRMRSVKLLDETFEPRSDFATSRLGDTRAAKVWFAPRSARWRVERGAQPLVDGAALEEMRVGSPDWLAGEILSFRGDAVVLEPDDLRARVAERARELMVQLAPATKPKAKARR